MLGLPKFITVIIKQDTRGTGTNRPVAPFWGKNNNLDQMSHVTIITLMATYNRSQKLLRQTGKTASYLKPQAIENSFKRTYGEVEDNIIIYIERLKT